MGEKQVGQTQIQTKIKFDKYQEGQTLIGTNMNRRGAIMKWDKHEVGQTSNGTDIKWANIKLDKL